MSASERAGAVRQEGLAASASEAAIQAGTLERWAVEADDQATDACDAARRPVPAAPGSTASTVQPAAVTPEERIAARRAEIARRSNEYYQHRARANARQNRRTLRIALFVCAVVVLAAAAFAAPLILKDRGAGYLGSLIWPAEETRVASLSGSGSVYMSPVPVREPQAPPPDQLASPASKDIAPEVSRAAMAPAALDVIVPAGEQTPAADPGLLYEEATGNADKPAVATEPLASSSPEPSTAIAGEPEAPDAQPTVVAALDPVPEKADADIERQEPAADTSMLTAEEARSLLERGDRLMQLGDIVSARAFYVRALEADRPGAALRLGSTFDPLIYRRMGVQGLKPDAKVAREWYLAAAAAGNADASRALDALKTHTGQ